MLAVVSETSSFRLSTIHAALLLLRLLLPNLPLPQLLLLSLLLLRLRPLPLHSLPQLHLLKLLLALSAAPRPRASLRAQSLALSPVSSVFKALTPLDFLLF